jgi:hypothetical protein
MKDMQAHLETLRKQIAECELTRDLAIDRQKRELFRKLAEHYKVLAAQVEMAISERMPLTFVGHKTPEAFPMQDE